VTPKSSKRHISITVQDRRMVTTDYLKETTGDTKPENVTPAFFVEDDDDDDDCRIDS